MKKRLAIGLGIIIFGAINYYIGLRGWQWITAATHGAVGGLVYWVLFWLLSAAFLLARAVGRHLPRVAADALTRVGAYWMLVYMYGLPLLLLFDIVKLLAGWVGWGLTPQESIRAGDVILLALVAAVLYGAWRARRPVVNRYEFTVPKRAGKHTALHIVLVSDTHLGAINGRRRLQAMVDLVNSLEPDLLLLAGDICDDDFGPFVAADMASGLKQLQAKLGVYSVLGNHEYIAGHLDEYRQEIARAGIHLLVDEWVKVDDCLYVIGRDDIAGRRFTGRGRKPLAELLQGVDPSLPLVLMDHQPYRLEEAEQAGIDLQVSGHTHRGQMFPNHLITRRVFELDWGYLRKGALHVVVSLGFGTWGPPVRIGNRPEVVSIRVRFRAQSHAKGDA